MAISSIKKDTEDKPVSFPKLMTTKSGTIILMTSKTQGAVIHEDTGGIHPLGYYSSSWGIQNLFDYEGSVTLSNK
jgi:hypothetical protein